MKSALSYRPEIDGLRAIAVAGVIIFHLNSSRLTGGFLGVDVFFVLSGFLITSIISAQLEAGNFSLLDFWKRRIRRLYPALAVMVTAVLAIGGIILIHPERGELPLQAVAALFSFENLLLLATTGGYWNSGSDNIALLHCWSLSLEEQFYICFPSALWLIHRFARKALLPVLYVGLIASFLGCLYLTPLNQPAAFYLLPTRMWELLIGSILAIHMRSAPKESPSRFTPVLQTVGLATVVASFFVVSGEQSFPGYLPIFPCLGTWLILKYGAAPGPVRWFLSLAPVVYVGRISYSLYLWHWPTIVFLNYLDESVSSAIPLVVTVILSVLSFHLVENPLRHGTARIRLATGVLSAALVTGFIPLFAFPGSPLVHLFPPEFANFDTPESVSRGEEYEALEELRNGEDGVYLNLEPELDIVVLGSSHARVLCPPIAEYCEDHDLSFLSMAGSGVAVTSVGRTTAASDTRELNIARLTRLRQLSPEVVIIAGKWNSEARRSNFDEILARNLKDISDCADHVFVLGQVPEIQLPEIFGKQVRRFVFVNMLHGEAPPLASYTDVRECNDLVEDVAESVNADNVEYIDPYDLFIRSDQSIRLTNESNMLYYDNGHLNDFGAQLVFDELLAERLERALAD